MAGEEADMRLLYLDPPTDFALVSDCDFAALSGYTWRPVRSGRTTYARASVGGQRVYLHRLIAGAGPGQIVDHINGDGLCCWRRNLRIVSHRQNMRNSVGRPAVRASRFKGVSPGTGRMAGRWRAQIKVHGRQHHLGYYDTEAEAANAYDRAAAAAFGEHARLNAI